MTQQIHRQAGMIFALLSALLLTTGTAAGVTLDRQTVIVTGKLENPNEKKALDELSAHLTKMLGGKLEIVPEAQWDGKGRAVILGHAAYLRKNGIDLSQADPEAYLIQAMPDGNLVISGGRERGVLYGVYSFLELAGCRFLAIDAKYIPRTYKINLPEKLRISRKPYFVTRSLYSGFWQMDLYSWHKLNPSFRNVGPRVHGQAHTFHLYTKDFPKGKDEYFAMTEPGKRPRAVSMFGPGQVCFTHPETRRLFKEKLRANIAKERQETQKLGLPPTQFYRITQNDNASFCYCEKCTKAVKKYDAESGLLLEFINDIAKDFPEINIITFVYLNTVRPPERGIKARKNVYVQIAQLRPTDGDPEREILLPLNAPENADAARQIREWGKIANIVLWDYLKIYSQPHPAPYTALPAFRYNLPFYAKNNTRSYFAEIEYFINPAPESHLNTHSFQELELYLTMKLMDDPFLDQDAVIRDFMRLYYGPAEKEMSACLAYLLKCQTGTMPPLHHVRTFTQCKYLDREFFSTMDRHLAEAARKTAGTEYYKRIQFERAILDSAWLYMWDKLADPKTDSTALRAEIVRRLTADSAATVKRFLKKSLDSTRVKQLCAPEQLGLPSELKNRKITYMAHMGFPKIIDPDSPTGAAAAILKQRSHDRPPVFGIYDFGNRKYLCSNRVLSAEEIPQDEKYHFFKIARIKPAEKFYVFGHWSWQLQYFGYDRFERGKEYEVWVSAKFTGPAYVKGSVRENGFYFDQALLVEAEPAKKDAKQ